MKRKQVEHVWSRCSCQCVLPLILLTVACMGLAAESSYQVRVVLTSGKQLILERPYSSVRVECEGFSLSTRLSLIDKISPREAGGYTVTFNDGDSLAARSLSGSAEYEGDFGRAKLDWSSVRSVETLANPRREKAVLSFNRGHYKYRTVLEFASGIKRPVYLAESDLSWGAKYKDLTVTLWPSRARLQFDWEKGSVKASLPGSPPIEFSLGGRASSKTRAETDLGQIEFDARRLVQSAPDEGSASAFQGEYAATLADETKIPIAAISHRCRDWSSHRGGCLQLDGRVVKEVFWPRILRIEMASDKPEGRVKFADGREGLLRADTLHVNWSFGTMEIPFSHAAFHEIVRTAEKTPAEAKDKPSHRLRLADGQEIEGALTSIGGWNTTTAPGGVRGVYRFYEIPVPAGTWLCEAAGLEFTATERHLRLSALGRTFEVPQPDRSNKLEFKTPYARFDLPLDKVASLALAESHTPKKAEKQYTVLLKTGEKHLLDCARLEFVRYPDRIWSGTMYRIELGAWFWRVEPNIEVKSEESTVNVELAKVRSLKVSGNYPEWNLEIESAKTGAILKARMTPAKVAKQGPGVSSWNREREGFAFWAHDRPAFLFVPIRSVAEIRFGHE